MHYTTLSRRVTTLLLFMLPAFTTYARKDFGGSGGDAAFAIIFLGIPLIIITNFGLSLVNLSAEKQWIRILNVILTIPMAVIAFWILSFAVTGGLIALGCVALQGVIIYASRPGKEKEWHTPTDHEDITTTKE